MMEIIFLPTSSKLFMSHWCTLNKGVAASDKDAVEIQIERLLEQYQTTLKLHQQGQLQLAKERYESLVSNDLVKKEPRTKLKDGTNQIEESPLSTLRFLVYKNYAAILETELLEGINDNNRSIAEKSLKCYLQAVKIDPTEYSLWYNIGYLANLLGNHRFARLAFETGFFMNRSNEKKLTIPVVQLDHITSIIKSGSLIPSQWKCLEGLCNTLFKIGDYPLCQIYIDNVTEVYPGWKLASELQLKISNSKGSLMEVVSDSDNDLQMNNSMETEDNKILLNLETPDWTTLIKAMLDGYKTLTCKNSAVDCKQNEKHIYSLNDIPFMNRTIEINIEEPQPTQLQEPEIITVPDSPIETSQEIMEGNMDEDDSTGLQKRKREDNNEDGGESQSENDDESEAEEKRASLRASKRQRQKIVNEETSRREMLEEETGFTTKIKLLFADISESKDCFKGIKWYPDSHSNSNDDDKVDISDAQFWEWFDIKVSELDSTYCWDIANTLKMMSDSNSYGNRKQMVMSDHSPSETDIVNDSDIKQFVACLNQSNSGISDSICKTILVIVNNDGNDTVMTEPLLEHITDAITLLESNFIEAILEPSFKYDKTSVILKICELYLDRLTRSTANTTEAKSIYPGNKRRASTSLIKQAQRKSIDQIAELCESWLGLFEYEIVSTSLDQKGFKNAECSKITEMQLRYFAARGKLAQHNDDIDRAYNWYTKCKSILQMHPISVNTKCMYDSILNANLIDEKLRVLQTSKLFSDTKKRAEQKDYVGIIEHLEGLVNTMLDSSSEYHYGSSETVLFLNYLAKAYIETNRLKDAWHYYARMFCYSIDELVSYGSAQIKSNAVLHKEEDTGFSKLLKCINDAIDNLVTLISKPNFEEWFILDSDQDLIKKLAILLQMSILYVFRHSDFIPLVNNFKNPDVPPHTPSRTTRSSGFNDILIKSWVLESKLLIHMYQKHELGVQDLMPRWASLLQDVHDDLGERVICGTAHSIFLKHLMNLLTDVDSINYRRGIYQCYHCLYGIHLAAESEMIEEHNTLHSELNENAAEALFLLVDQAVCDKLNSGASLKNDLKDAIDNISEIFEELPSGNHLIEKNKQLINAYLESDLKIDCTFAQLLRKTIMPAVNLTPKKCHLSPVYFKIFWIRGKIVRLQIKNRQKSNSDKNFSDLEKAIEEFSNHLILNPDDPSGWCELGACLQQLAEEELNWSASNILSHIDTIGDYQKKACQAYLRCIHLKNQSDGLTKNKNDSITRKKNSYMFMNFGDLAYSIVCPPMKLEALKPNTVRRKLGQDGELVEIQSKLPDSTLVYKLALTMYNQALRFNYSGWRCLYMIGKCFSKLKRAPKDVLDLYFQAIKRDLHQQQGDREIDLEPIYTLCATMVKYLYNGKIEPAAVQEYLKNEKELYNQSIKENSDNPASAELHHSSNNSKPVENALIISDDFTTRESLSARATHLPSDVAYAYNGIFDRLSELRKMDKKKWHHRIIYRISWMYYYIYHNAEKAKNEMMQLFTLRTTVKNHINIWIPGFELPGKHFEYVHKYTVFLIELAKETKDTTCLKNLYKKLRRGQSLMLHDKEVYQLAYSAYLEIIDLQLRTVHHAEQILEKVVECKIDKESLQGLCDKYTKALITEKPKIESELMGYLQDLLDIKRLNHSYLNDPKLDTTIQLCYGAIAFSSEDALSELHSFCAKVGVYATDVQQTPNDTDETIVADNNLGHKERLDILVQQAKMLLQNSSVKS